MPVLHLNLIRGYDEATRRRLTSRLTDAVLATIAADPQAVTVFVHEVDPSGYARGGRPGADPDASASSVAATARVPGSARPDAEAVVRAYLGEMEARDLESAAKRLEPGFTMQFPGPVSFSEPGELIEWASTRYRRVGKIIDDCESVFRDGSTIVWCHGTLFGEWPDGQPFEGIRFVDRFTVQDGLIVDQRVWNDLAEVRAGMAQ